MSVAQCFWKMRSSAVAMIEIIDRMIAMTKRCLRSLSAYDPATRIVAAMILKIKIPCRNVTANGLKVKTTRMEMSSARCRQGYSRVAIALLD